MKTPVLAARAASIKNLRPHQIPAVARVMAAWNGERRPSDPAGTLRRRAGLDLAVAYGKTVTNGHIIKQRLLEGQRALYLVDRDALVQQAVDDLSAVLTDVTIGVVQGARNEVWADVVVAMRQTLEDPRRREQIKDVALVIYDEMHGAAARTAVEILEHYGVDFSDPPAPDSTLFVGCTGTMVRTDDKILVGPGGIVEEVVYRKTIPDGVREGWLVRPIPHRAKVRPNRQLTTANTTTANLDDNYAEQLVNADSGNTIADSIFEVCRLPNGELGQGLVYVSRVSAAVHVCDVLNERGIRTAVVSAKTPRAEFVKIMQDLDAGHLDCIVNVGKLTTGFDKRYLTYVVIARPTKSKGLIIQIIGRVLRLSPETGKTSAHIIDVSGITDRDGGLNLVTVDDVFEEMWPESTGKAKRDADVPDDLLIEPFPDEEPAEIHGELVITALEDISDDLTSVRHQTFEGMSFFATELAYFYVWPRTNGRYNVRKCPTWKGNGCVTPQRRRDSVTLEKDIEFEDALEWASSAAERADPTMARKDRKWRAGKPSQEQVETLSGNPRKNKPGLGAVQGEHYVTRGDAADLLTKIFASKILDQ